MATEKETVILEFQVDQGSAIAELEKTKKSIIGLKQEQTELNKAYKAGNITLDEYAEESVRLEAILKKQQATYSNTQKSVTGVKTSMDKLTESVKNSSQNITIAGTNVGQLGQKLTALANPVTATVAIVGALGAAYARSTIGAKDLAFASNQLSAATTILTNSFASLISSADDGEGAFTKILNGLLRAGGLGALADTSKAIAMTQEALEDLGRNEIEIRGNVSERLADNQDIISEINQEQTNFNRKLELTAQLESNIRRNTQELLVVKGEQLKSAQAILGADSENETKQRAVLLLGKEIDKILLDESKKLKTVDVLTDNIKTNEQKRLDAIKKQREETAKNIKQQEEERLRLLSQGDFTSSFDPESPFSELDPEAQFKKDANLINAELQLVRTAEQEKQTLALNTNAVEQMIHDEKVARFQAEAEMLRDGFNTIANLFSDGSEAKRVFALAGIGADTASAIASLTANSEANPANAFTFGGAGIAQYAAGIIRILGNIVAAKQFLGGSFAGGGDFVTSKPTMLLVGDNPGGRERVTVEPLSGVGKTHYNPRSGLMAMAGGGSLTFDGNRDLAVQSVSQMIQLKNSIKNMPKPVVGVKQFADVANEVLVKQNISSF